MRLPVKNKRTFPFMLHWVCDHSHFTHQYDPSRFISIFGCSAASLIGVFTMYISTACFLFLPHRFSERPSKEAFEELCNTNTQPSTQQGTQSLCTQVTSPLKSTFAWKDNTTLYELIRSYGRLVFLFALSRRQREIYTYIYICISMVEGRPDRRKLPGIARLGLLWYRGTSYVHIHINRIGNEALLCFRNR